MLEASARPDLSRRISSAFRTFVCVCVCVCVCVLYYKLDLLHPLLEMYTHITHTHAHARTHTHNTHTHIHTHITLSSRDLALAMQMLSKMTLRGTLQVDS
jgi:hypothetical protein